MTRWSDLTVTDQFCGAGGSSLGARDAGLRIRMAMNHWKLAIDTHNTNFPDTDHDCADVSAVDPRRYPSTDILITSPECTNHSLAKGAKRKGQGQSDLFRQAPIDPSEERSRATMWDVPRFAEFHKYRCIIVENVVDARMWIMWDAWLMAMHALGYDHKAVYLNSMFAHPTPQSRDRMYVVFWKRGNRPPDLDIRPRAFCASCSDDVDAVQSWKNGRTAGRYRRQYIYTCHRCRREVNPYYYAALNAIDWTIPAERIGDRAKPLRERTLGRIRYGLEKYGRTPLLVTTNMTSDGGRSRPVGDPHFTQTGSNITALVSPFLVETLYSQAGDERAIGAEAPMPTQSTRQSLGIASPMLVPAGSNPGAAVPVDEAAPTMTCSDRLGLAVPPSFLMTYRNQPGVGYRIGGLDEPANTVVTELQQRLIISPAALLTMRDSQRAYLLRGIDEPMATQVATATQDFLIQRAPFFVSYYGNNQAAAAHEPVDTITTKDRHAIVQANDEDLRVEDCYFRMLQPHEIGAAMAFPDSYVVLGNKRDKVKQFGNAVTPPAMKILIQRCVESLHPEMAA